MPLKIYLVSPREPSGATWLINCLLELGIMCYRVSKKRMWSSVGGNQWQLTEYEKKLRKWLPFLSKNDVFKFHEGIEVEWTHEWPTKKFVNSAVIYFLRDPRDALYSRFKRENPIASFQDFIRLRDPITLMDKIDNWIAFNDSWLEYKNKAIFLFEDSKKEPVKVLKDVLKSISVSVPEEMILNATAESTFEKASASEDAYRKINPYDQEKICRSGKANSWREECDDEEIAIFEEIQIKTLRTLEAYGYSVNATCENYYPNIKWQKKYLSFFEKLINKPAYWNSDTLTTRQFEDSILDFVGNYDTELTRKFNWKQYEVMGMAETLTEFVLNFQHAVMQQIHHSLPGEQIHSQYYMNMFLKTHDFEYLKKIDELGIKSNVSIQLGKVLATQ